MDSSAARTPQTITTPSLPLDSATWDRRRAVPDFVAQAIANTASGALLPRRSDHCRLAYLLRALPLDHVSTITEIGARDGFLSLSLAHAFPRLRVTACEPDQARARFIRSLSRAFHLSNLEVIPKPVTLRSLAALDHRDVALLINVLDHAGHRFDTALPRTRAAFTEYIGEYLAGLAAKRHYLFFQMGAEWEDATRAAFPDLAGLGGPVRRRPGVDELRYLSSLLVNSGWTICRVGYPTRVNGDVVYRDLPEMVAGALSDDPDGVFDEVLNAGLHGLDIVPCPGESCTSPIFTCASTRPQHRPA